MLDKTTAAPTKTIPEPLFIFELANNHMGDIDHGLRVVAEFGALARKSISTSPSSCNFASSTPSSIRPSGIGPT